MKRLAILLVTVIFAAFCCGCGGRRTADTEIAEVFAYMQNGNTFVS